MIEIGTTDPCSDGDTQVTATLQVTEAHSDSVVYCAEYCNEYCPKETPQILYVLPTSPATSKCCYYCGS